MQIAYDLKESTIAGLGLFAKERISKGALLWKYSEQSVRTYANADEVRAELARRPPEAVIHFLEHAYCWDGLVCEILDDGRFWNHSKAPNTGTLPDDPASSFALRDIEPGEELLDDYSQHDMLAWFEAICKEHEVSSSSKVGVEFD
ncbi:hypothetical protein KFE25_011067 [Diacronema lutheri]|uniref:SET domain-containing protein n=1 Tax=Diacronema lutheri TaxID=2081491 RepID=A0A7R9YHI9_DIALT|nr:hypothetical protein KFE25_011067 [Diacronema lutheri]|mmetsp:Transcript_11748/g.37245  ORF Transcript_11748/g.37245 Transcript_11748/m.37245 type:complete len:146 (+) Transcript_11748:66-503(+)